MSAVVARGPVLAVTIVVARLRQRVGVPGLIGLALMAATAVSMSLAWQQHHRLDLASGPIGSLVPNSVPAPTRSTSKTGASTQSRLPPASDIPLLLTRMERAAQDQGLGWPRADYRLNAASEDVPASLEVHCTLKGPYPSIRRFVTALLQDAPALTLREFSLSRTNADVGDVEAKLSIVVYLASGAPSAAGPLR